MDSGFKNRGWIVGGALLVLLALGNDVVEGIQGLLRWAAGPTGQATMPVLLLLLMVYLVIDKFVDRRGGWL
jgi:hypothetical protein